MTTSENIRSNLTQLIEPLRDQLEELDSEIGVTEQRLAFMRQTKRDVTRALALIDPTFVTTTETKPKNYKGPHVAPKTLSDVREWLSARSDEFSKESFSAASIRRDQGYSMYSQSITLTALKVLHSEGFLRLDHTGVAGSRYYKVVSNG